MSRSIEISLNGRQLAFEVSDEDILLDVLREKGGVTSVREGCGVGACGACTALISGASVSTCLCRAADYDKAEILTVEGLPKDDPVIEAFLAAGALQCGYCIPGFVLMTHELLGENPDPSPAEIRGHLAGNLCRCGTYYEIAAAVLLGAKAGGSSRS